jgi:hypothetical protein
LDGHVVGFLGASRVLQLVAISPYRLLAFK